jgi:hypothetical protein
MGYMSDVKSTRLAGAGGAIFGGPARVKGVYIVSSGTGGSVVIKDGGVWWYYCMYLRHSCCAAGMVYMKLPEDGLRCATDAYAVLTDVTAATFFYA